MTNLKPSAPRDSGGSLFAARNNAFGAIGSAWQRTSAMIVQSLADALNRLPVEERAAVLRELGFKVTITGAPAGEADQRRGGG